MGKSGEFVLPENKLAVTAKERMTLTNYTW